MRSLKLTVVVALFSVITARPTEKAEDIQSLKEYVELFRRSTNLPLRMGETNDAQEKLLKNVADAVYQMTHNNHTVSGDEELAQILNQMTGKSKYPPHNIVAPVEGTLDPDDRTIEKNPAAMASSFKD